MSKHYHIGIIGAGNVARFHAKAIADIPNAILVGVCDGGSGRARTLAKEFQTQTYPSYHTMLDDDQVDLVTIATPSGYHLEPTVLAAQKGKHVLCEKPLEITPQRIDQMIQAHIKAGTYLGGIFNFRYDSAVAKIKEAVETGRLGTITYAAVHVPWWRSEDYYAGNWRGTQKLDGGGALMNQSIHMIDLLQYLLGPVASLFAYTATLAHQIEVEDTAVAVLRFQSGVLGQIYGSTASFPGQPRQLMITGTEGSIKQVDDNIEVWSFKNKVPDDELVLKNPGTATGVGGASDPMAIPYDNHARNISAFLEAIDHQQPFAIDGREAKKAVEIICAIYESQQRGREIELS